MRSFESLPMMYVMLSVSILEDVLCPLASILDLAALQRWSLSRCFQGKTTPGLVSLEFVQSEIRPSSLESSHYLGRGGADRAACFVLTPSVWCWLRGSVSGTVSGSCGSEALS